MDKEILKKYLNNKCTNKEFDELVGWVKKDAHNKENETWAYNDWKSFNPEDKHKNHKKYNSILDKIHHKINLKNQAESKVITMSNVTSWLSRAAAILFLPLLGVMLYMLSNNYINLNKYAETAVDSLEIIAPVGSRTIVQLSDGTEVNLNFGSKIKYPQKFTGDTREITLVGEGFFDVTHNPKKPFIVKTAKLDIKALGTEFNVQAYPDDDVVSTTLIEGKVVIEKTIMGEKVESVGAMVPGQHVAYNIKSGKITSSKGSVDKYIAWKNGKLVFDNDPITDVAERLSRMFNVDIEIADNVRDNTYTVTFVEEPLFLILDLMTETTPVTYKAFPRKKLSDGSYSKQRIRIEKRL